MSKRKPLPPMTPPTPAPIDELLDPKSAQNKKTERQKNGKTEKVISVKTQKRNVSKSKCTYYIPTELAERIDLAHAQARVYTRGSRYKASKSEFIEAALLFALANFDENGQNSEIVEHLSRLIDNTA